MWRGESAVMILLFYGMAIAALRSGLVRQQRLIRENLRPPRPVGLRHAVQEQRFKPGRMHACVRRLKPLRHRMMIAGIANAKSEKARQCNPY